MPPSRECSKSADTFIGVETRSVSIGGDECGVSSVEQAAADKVILTLICNRPPAAVDAGLKDQLGARPALPKPEAMFLKKVDDKSIFVQRSRDGELTELGKLSYCDKDAQQTSAPTTTKK